MVIDYQLVRGAKWYIRFLYKIKMNDKNKEKSKKKGDAPQSGERMMGFFRCASETSIIHLRDKKVRHRIRIRLGDLLYL